MDLFVFGYGSLMNVESASRALKRTLFVSDLTPAFLVNYKRVWTLKENIFSEKLNKIVTGVFLDLEFKNNTASLNGVLIKISKDEYNYLKKREKNYDEFDITDIVEFDKSNMCTSQMKVITFVAKKEYKIDYEESFGFIMKRYLDMLELACDQFDDSFKLDYKESTEDISFPILNGTYKFVDLEQAKYV